MQGLPRGLELYDLVPEGAHLGFNAVDRPALFEEFGAERLLPLAAAITACNTAISSKRRREQTDKAPPSVDREGRRSSASNKIALFDPTGTSTGAHAEEKPTEQTGSSPAARK